MTTESTTAQIPLSTYFLESTRYLSEKIKKGKEAKAKIPFYDVCLWINTVALCVGAAFIPYALLTRKWNILIATLPVTAGFMYVVEKITALVFQRSLYAWAQCLKCGVLANLNLQSDLATLTKDESAFKGVRILANGLHSKNLAERVHVLNELDCEENEAIALEAHLVKIMAVLSLFKHCQTQCAGGILELLPSRVTEVAPFPWELEKRIRDLMCAVAPMMILSMTDAYMESTRPPNISPPSFTKQQNDKIKQIKTLADLDSLLETMDPDEMVRRKSLS